MNPRSFGPWSVSRRERPLTVIGFATAELAQPRSALAESTRRRDAIRSRSLGIIPNSADISDLAGFLLGVKSPDSPASGLECDVMIVFMVSAASAANMAGTACVIFIGKFSFRRLKALTHRRHALRRGSPPPGPSPNISYIIWLA